jgi:23S rRNA (pseudouridine1915-N3)-methyltransferase
MEIALAAVGRLKAGPERELCDRFLDRARRSGARHGFHGFTVKELPESRAPRSQDRLRKEQAELLAILPRVGRIICLHERGDLLDSQSLAAALRRDAAQSVSRTTFVIGGPDGLGSGVLDLADWSVAFGRLTWPHQIVRILLAEQLYRAMTILSGHPYHRA